MTPTRTTKADNIEIVLQGRIRQGHLTADDLIKEKLADLQAFICHLAQTPNGKVDLQRRVQVLGKCLQVREETDRHFYGRLRLWLDRDV